MNKNRKTYNIRANFNETHIQVYQAFSYKIADIALANQKFKSPFSMSRMSWIKPSFNWMMYRSGFGTKPNQECILAIEVKRTGFDWLLQQGCLSHFDTNLHDSIEIWRRQLQASSVRIQWDPERRSDMSAIEHERAIQVGLSGNALQRYVYEFVDKIDDHTEIARKRINLLQQGKSPEAVYENVYPRPNGTMHIFPDADIVIS